jgi:hypothetical protein
MPSPHDSKAWVHTSLIILSYLLTCQRHGNAYKIPFQLLNYAHST